MNIFQQLVVLSMSACVLVASASVSAQALTPLQVAERYDDEFRHPTLTVKFKLSTCKYTIEQAQMRCSEKPRARVVENVLKSYGKDIRTVAILSEPISDRGIGMLGWQYWDKNKVNDYWIYLPALNKVKRVVSTKDSKDSGSYFGSEFYIEDLEGPRLDDYTYKILGEENITILEVGKGYVETPAYVLEWMPTAQKNDATNYGKLVMWIDKKRFILLKGEYYDHDQVLQKRRTIKNLELVDGRWTPRQVTMDNLPDRRVTLMDRQGLAIGMTVDEEYFTQRTLTDEVFRERYLSRFRTLWKQ
jgi:hypothetical protein